MTETLDLTRTSDYWDVHAGQGAANRAEWLGHPLVAQRLLQVRGGQALEQWCAARFLGGRPVARALSIGSGVGHFELSLVRLGAVQHYDLYDVSPVALETAMENARSFGIADRIAIHHADINGVALPREAYGLVTFISALHHISEIERVLHNVRDALAPDGVLFASEYTGPDRFDYPEDHAGYAKRLYRALDPALRCPWPELPQPNPVDVIAADPTESIHSSQILDTVRQIFSNCTAIPYGLTLTPILWWGLNHDALYETEQGRDFVATLLNLDGALVGAGVLPSYFHYLAARKVPPPGSFAARVRRLKQVKERRARRTQR